MTTFLTWTLTPLLVLDCLLLGLLILVQLPKKEAGIGMAFGGGAADALFGAGSGNTLTKLTKYTAGFFFGLVLLLSMVNISAQRSNIGQMLNKLPQTQPSVLPPTTPADTNTPAINFSNTPAGTNLPIDLMGTNMPAGTNK